MPSNPQNTTRLIIIDDEPLARHVVRGMLEAHFQNVLIAGEAADVPEAVKLIHREQPDVVLLDVEMPGYSGIELLRFFATDQINFKIIFITAYSDYAITAFEMAALDYLLKPLQLKDLERALSRVGPMGEQDKAQLRALQDNLSATENPKIALQVADGLHIVALNDIIYLKADGSYTHVFLSKNIRLTVSKKLIEYEKLERYPQFIRLHRSHIANLNRVAKYLKQDGGTLVMENNDYLSISQDKKNKVMAWWEQNKI
jgi:two-component system, LytTR family, response regulator